MKISRRVTGVAAALRTIYDTALYHLSIDYTQDPPPSPLSNEELTWLSTQLAPYRST